MSVPQRLHMQTVDPNVTLRPVVKEDDEFLYTAYASTRLDEVAMFGWNEGQQQAFLRMQFNGRQMAYKMQFPTAEQSIILKDKSPVGQVIVDRTPDKTVLTDIIVLPDFRGGGVGGVIVETLKSEASLLGRPLVLRVDRTNGAAIRFYERHGFVTSDETELLYELRWNPPS